MMELFAFVILLTLTEAQENQWERPENTSSIVGSNVTLKCSSPSGDCSLIEWLKQDGHPATVFSDRGIIAKDYRSRYRVDNFSGCDLVIEDVELRDAGRFICRAFISHDTVEKTVFLTISAELGYKLAGPENAISAVGSNVTLRCSSPSRNCDGTEWLKYGASGNLRIISNDRGVISNTYGDRYRVDNSSGCDLVIKNVELTDAGRFICRAFISSQTVEKSAYLVILETQPSCTLNISLNETAEGDIIRLTCEVKYCGTNKATILWKDVKNTGETQPNAVEVKATQLNCKVTSHATSMGTNNGNTISWSYYVKASTSDFSSFTCITSFALDDAKTNGTQIKGLATDIPSATCETPVIKVLYSVRNVTLSPSRSYHSPGNDIICTARGNPSPIFKWQEIENDGTWTEIQNLNGSKFTITNASFKRYRCIAMNVIRGKTHNATSHEFHVKNIDSDKISEVQPLTENPDICVYSVVNKGQGTQSKAKPSSGPSIESPKQTQGASPQAKPRKSNTKAGNAIAYQHEEVTYADLAMEFGPRQVVPKYNKPPQETLYAAVGAA